MGSRSGELRLQRSQSGAGPRSRNRRRRAPCFGDALAGHRQRRPERTPRREADGWRINIQSQAAKDRVEAGRGETLAFEPYAPGETPDIDIISEAEDIAAAAEEEAALEEAATPAPALATTAPETDAPAVEEEEEVSFAAIVNQMAVPKGEDRESEDYGEDEDEEYEIPTSVVTEARPAAIRFGEVSLAASAQPKRRPPRPLRRRSNAVRLASTKRKKTTWTTLNIPAGFTSGGPR